MARIEDLVGYLTWDACRFCIHTPDGGPCGKGHLTIRFDGAGGVFCQSYCAAETDEAEGE